MQNILIYRYILLYYINTNSLLFDNIRILVVIRLKNYSPLVPRLLTLHKYILSVYRYYFYIEYSIDMHQNLKKKKKKHSSLKYEADKSKNSIQKK